MDKSVFVLKERDRESRVPVSTRVCDQIASNFTCRHSNHSNVKCSHLCNFNDNNNNSITASRTTPYNKISDADLKFDWYAYTYV